MQRLRSEHGEGEKLKQIKRDTTRAGVGAAELLTSRFSHLEARKRKLIRVAMPASLIASEF